MLTVVVVDDIVALVVIAVVYTTRSRVSALLVGLGLFGVVLVAAARCRVARTGSSTSLLGRRSWVALLESGVDPIVVGLAMGLLAYAYPAARADLERATELFRAFREQPTPELARSARIGLSSAISPNERLQQLYHPWTSYVIVPAVRARQRRHRRSTATSCARLHLADHARDPGRLRGRQAGRASSGVAWLRDAADAADGCGRRSAGPPSPAAARSPGSASPSRCSSRRSRSRATELEEAKLGILSAALGASLLTWLVFRATARLPRSLRIRALLGHGRAARRPLRRRRSGARPHARAASTRRSRSSSTATSSARTAGRPSRSSASCCATSATSATCGGTCRSTTSTRTPSSRPRRPRRRPSRARSGRCTTCCSRTRTRSARAT